MAKLRIEKRGAQFGFAVYMGLIVLLALLSSWIKRYIGEAASGSLLILTVPGALVMGPASDWFVSHFYKNGSQ